MMLKKSMALMVVAWLSACAHSPQQLNLQPQIELSGERYGEGKTVTVLAEDRRPSTVIGNLGGAYPESSIVDLVDVETALSRAAEAHLAAQGFNINSQQQDVAQCKIILESLSYEIPERVVGKTVKLHAVMKAELSYQGERYSGRYETETEHLLPVTPSKEKNEALLNELVSKTLSRLFADKRLQAFLSNI